MKHNIKATLTREEYKDFNTYVDYLSVNHNISIPHTVEYQGDKFIVEILDDVSLEGLDEILDV